MAVAPRPPHAVPAHLLIEVDDSLGLVSSTAARAGALAQMTTAARRFDERSGAWTDPTRYEAWLLSSS